MEYSNLPASDLPFATPNIKQIPSIDFVNTPINPINIIPETPNLFQKYINGKESIRRIIQTFTDNIFEDMKIANLKTKIISSLESTISFWFQKEFSTFKDSVKNYCRIPIHITKGQIDNLRKEIKNKDEIICKLSATLKNITNILPIKDRTIALNGNNLVLETAPSNYNEKILLRTVKER